MKPTSERLQRLAWELMQKYRPLPEGKSGDFAVVNEPHVAGEKLQVVNMREAMFSGLPETKLVLPGDYNIQKLTESGGVWMSNLPCELVQMHREFASTARGNVLIGGLGLGIITDMCRQRPMVKRCTVVELEQDVVNLNRARLADGITIMQGDLLKVIDEIQPGEFDKAFYDIWQSDGEWTWQTIVVPLRRKSYGKIKDVTCWHEDVMLNQVWRSIMIGADISEEHTCRLSTNHRYAFRVAARDLGFRPKARFTDFQDIENYVKLEQENQNDGSLRWLAHVFLKEVGSPQWERYFGAAWDEASSEKMAS